MVTAANSPDDCFTTPRLTPMRIGPRFLGGQPSDGYFDWGRIEAVGGAAARFGYQAAEGVGRRRRYRMKGTSILVERLYVG
jgi:hypothetical protein